MQGNVQKVNWFSSIPDKYRNEIVQKMQDKIKEDKGKSLKDFQVYLNINPDSPHHTISKTLQKPDVVDDIPTDYNLGSFEPKFKVQPKGLPKVMSMKYMLKKIADTAEKPTEIDQSKSATDFMYQNNEKIMELLANNVDPISTTYSVKYLGITDGKIGILSRRLPLPLAAKPKKEYSPPVKPANFPPVKRNSELSQKPKSFIAEKPSKPDTPIQPKEKEKVYTVYHGNEYDNFMPRSTHPQPVIPEVIKEKTEKVPLEPKIEITKAKPAKKAEAKKKVAPKINLPKAAKPKVIEIDNPQDKVTLETPTQITPQIDLKVQIPKPKIDESLFTPHPEKYDQYIVHTYSLPKGLSAGKRMPILSDSEKEFGDKYSKENINIMLLERRLETMKPQRGLKGFKLVPISDKALTQSKSKPVLKTTDQLIISPSIKKPSEAILPSTEPAIKKTDSEYNLQENDDISKNNMIIESLLKPLKDSAELEMREKASAEFSIQKEVEKIEKDDQFLSMIDNFSSVKTNELYLKYLQYKKLKKEMEKEGNPMEV